tara:strand:+ start:93 stop:293 length:201 start_codon:yes stop_codon:yes gene_type:complete
MKISKKTAPKKNDSIKKQGKWKVKQDFPYSPGVEPQLLVPDFKSEKEAESYIETNKMGACSVVKVD